MAPENKKVDLKKELTIFVTVRNRQWTVQRVANYYRCEHKANVVIIDSSESPVKEMDNPEILGKNVKYLHLPGKHYVEKLHDCLEQIDTKYSIVVCDDDFLCPTGLETAVNFLEENPDVVSVRGQNAGIWDPEAFVHKRGVIAYDVVEYMLEYLHPTPNDLTDLERTQRAWVFFDGSNVHSLMRTQTHIEIQKWHLNNHNLNAMSFYDKTFTFLLASYGKMMVLPVFWILRSQEVGAKSLITQKNAANDIKNWNPELKFSSDFLKFDTSPLEKVVGVDRKWIEVMHHHLTTGGEKERVFKEMLANEIVITKNPIPIGEYDIHPKLGPGGNLSGEHGWRERIRAIDGHSGDYIDMLKEYYPILQKENVEAIRRMIHFIDDDPLVNRNHLKKLFEISNNIETKCRNEGKSLKEYQHLIDEAWEQHLNNLKYEITSLEEK